jgi:hypothetical protein
MPKRHTMGCGRGVRREGGKEAEVSWRVNEPGRKALMHGFAQGRIINPWVGSEVLLADPLCDKVRANFTILYCIGGMRIAKESYRRSRSAKVM